MTAPSRVWTQSDVEHLRKLASEGMRVAAIALRLGRTYDAVKFRAKKEGIAFPSIGRRAPEPGSCQALGSDMNAIP
jgi:hypothetical protein